jgi:hypothetical protein
LLLAKALLRCHKLRLWIERVKAAVLLLLQLLLVSRRRAGA